MKVAPQILESALGYALLPHAISTSLAPLSIILCEATSLAKAMPWASRNHPMKKTESLVIISHKPSYSSVELLNKAPNLAVANAPGNNVENEP